MKKLILITGLFISTSVWANTNTICNYNLLGLNDDLSFFVTKDREYIRSNCAKDNILKISALHGGSRSGLIAQFCRFDRNVHEHQHSSGNWTVTCVLNSNEPRNYDRY